MMTVYDIAAMLLIAFFELLAIVIVGILFINGLEKLGELVENFWKSRKH